MIAEKKKNINVTLTQEEMAMAIFIGGRRKTESIFSERKRQVFSGPSADLWSIDIEGACAEEAYCKALNQYWGGTVCSFKGPDAGKDIQIRS